MGIHLKLHKQLKPSCPAEQVPAITQIQKPYKLDDLFKKIDNKMVNALNQLNKSAPSIQAKNLLRLKGEILNATEQLKMTELRRNYLLHQLANVHSTDQLVDLLGEINSLQLVSIKKDSIPQQDLIFIAEGPHGIILDKQAYPICTYSH